MGHMDARGLWPARIISHPHLFVLARTGIFASMLATLPPRPRRPQAHGVADTRFCSLFLQPRLCFAEGSHPSSQIRVAAVRRECSCRSRSLLPPMIATCRALQAKCHPEHGNVVRDWERSQSRVKISMGGEEARHSSELLHHLLGCVVSYTSSSPGASAAREVFRWVRSREFL